MHPGRWMKRHAGGVRQQLSSSCASTREAPMLVSSSWPKWVMVQQVWVIKRLSLVVLTHYQPLTCTSHITNKWVVAHQMCNVMWGTWLMLAICQQVCVVIYEPLCGFLCWCLLAIRQDFSSSCVILDLVSLLSPSVASNAKARQFVCDCERLRHRGRALPASPDTKQLKLLVYILISRPRFDSTLVAAQWQLRTISST